MIAQVRAASYRGNVLYYIEKSACCQAQICRKCNFLQKQAGWAVWRRQNDFKWSPRCSDHIQRKDYFKFRVWSDRVCAAIKAPVGLLSGRAVCVSRDGGALPRQALRSATNAFSREGFRTNSLSQNLTVLPAPSGREPLARPQTLHFSRELCRHHGSRPLGEGGKAAGFDGRGNPLRTLRWRLRKQKTKRTSSEEPVRHGRGSKFRTHGTRFWRPLLYQLSYTPICIR